MSVRLVGIVLVLLGFCHLADAKTEDEMDKVIHISAVLDVNQKTAFDFFTDNRHLENWLAEIADVEAKVGGKYELFWNPADKENDSTIGCKVLALSQNQFIAFEWKGPKQFKMFMNTTRPLTQVTVVVTPLKSGTQVHLLHSGWREGKDWDEAFTYFRNAWTMAFKALEKYSKDMAFTQP